jgi:hypothetical protein
MLTVLYADCHCAECRYAEFHYAECHCAECRYAEFHYAEFNTDLIRTKRKLILQKMQRAKSLEVVHKNLIRLKDIIIS